MLLGQLLMYFWCFCELHELTRFNVTEEMKLVKQKEVTCNDSIGRLVFSLVPRFFI